MIKGSSVLMLFVTVMLFAEDRACDRGEGSATSQPRTRPMAQCPKAVVPECWTLRITEARLDASGVVSVQATLLNCSEEAIMLEYTRVRDSLMDGLRIWRRDTDGCFRSVLVVSEHPVEVPGDGPAPTLPSDPEFRVLELGPGQSLDIRWTRAAARDEDSRRIVFETHDAKTCGARLKSARLEPGTYVVDATLELQWSIGRPGRPDLPIFEWLWIPSCNKVWVTMDKLGRAGR